MSPNYIYMNDEQDGVSESVCCEACKLSLHLLRITEATCNAPLRGLNKWFSLQVPQIFLCIHYTSCSIHDIEPILGIAKLMKSL